MKENRMKKRNNILTQADICNAREALYKPPKADMIYLTPGEFKSVYVAFERMENEIKELRRDLQLDRLDNKYLSEIDRDMDSMEKIDPSEVKVKVTLDGTVKPCSVNTFELCTNEGSNWIGWKELDPNTAALVKTLLAAQGGGE